MSYMAMFSTHALYAAPFWRGVSFSSPNRGPPPQLSWWCHSSPPSAPASSLPSSAVGSSCELGYGWLEPESAGLTYSGSKQIEETEQEAKHSMAHSLWLGLLLRWTLALETRRSFITGSVQRLCNRIIAYCPSQLSPAQPGTPLRQDKFARRVALTVPFVITASTSCNSLAKVSSAEDTRNAGSSFLQNFGIGERDIYYPRIFAGSWVCNSTLVAVDTPQGEDKADLKSVEFSRKQLGFTVTYKARFLPFEKHIVADRLFTTLSLVQSTVGSNVVDHGLWTPQQPDRLTLVLRGGRKVQNVVTKRSASLLGPGQFDTSEYSQQIFDNSRIEGGPPTIKASQNRTRYRWDASNEDVLYIEALQRVSMFPVIQEGLTNMDLMNLDKPVAVYKYIVRFTRETS